MAENEGVLLRRFVSAGDPEAFAEVVRRYAGLVYGTCMRVLVDADKAADATQETFFQLMKSAGEVKGSPAAWLHRVAVRKAVDRIRADSARRQREKKHGDPRSDEDRTWQEVLPYVDEALTRLDEPTRELLIRHYLEGRSMADLAQERGVSRATISRQMESGLTRIKAQLQRQGILATVAALSTLLSASTAQSAPAALLQQLGKMAMLGAEAGTAAASLPSALAGGLAAAAKVKLMVVAAVVVVGAGLITYTISTSGPPEDALPVAPPSRQGRPVSGRTSVSSEPSSVERTDPQPPDQQSEPQTKPAATPPTQVTAAPEVTDNPPVMPSRSEAITEDEPRLDLSSPEATVRSFTKAMISGDAESVMACMLPNGTDYEDVQDIVDADPDDPRQRTSYTMKLWLQSFDPDAEMPIVSTDQTDRGTSIVWRVTFKKDVTMEGHTFRAGETYDMDARLRQSGDSWLIDGI